MSAALQALVALDEHLLQHVAPPVRSGIEMMTAVGQLRPTGSPRWVICPQSVHLQTSDVPN